MLMGLRQRRRETAGYPLQSYSIYAWAHSWDASASCFCFRHFACKSARTTNATRIDVYKDFGACSDLTFIYLPYVNIVGNDDFYGYLMFVRGLFQHPNPYSNDKLLSSCFFYWNVCVEILIQLKVQSFCPILLFPCRLLMLSLET